MSSTGTLTSGVAGRYATALFELSKGAGTVDQLDKDVDAVATAIRESRDLRDMIGSPIYSRDEQGRAIAGIAEKMGLGEYLTKTLGLMAGKRRLFAVPAMLDQLKALIADDRGEIKAEVTSAKPLSDAQTKSLAEHLKSAVGKDVKLDVAVDDGLIGGLLVKVGSRMIDTSIRSKLARLQNIMKEVG